MKMLIKVGLLLGLLVVSKLTQNNLLKDELSGFAGLTHFKEQKEQKPADAPYPVQVETKKSLLQFN